MSRSHSRNHPAKSGGSVKKPLCPQCGEPCVKRGNSRGVQRWGHKVGNECSWHGTRPVGLDAPSTDTKAMHALVHNAKGPQRYLITSAQNATAVNLRFLRSLLTYCRINKAQLLVVPYRYKNPTSIWSRAAADDDWWAPELVPHLIDRRTKLCAGLVLLADIKTQPTASRPLQGFENITGGDSAVIGHPKIELTTIATPQHRLAKILTTTGGVTVKNYLPGKAGKKGEHHHTFGACVVEMADGLFHLRHINACHDGGFQDLALSYSGETCNPANVEALVMGDTHEEVVDPAVVKATFTDENSIVKTLKPKYLVWHDVHDFYSRNHHHRGDPIINYVKHHSGADNVERALDRTFAFIDSMTPPGAKNVFVPSNHPDALARWIKESDPRSDPENCVFWARTFEAMCLGSKMTETGAATVDPFAFWAIRKLKTANQAVFLKHDQRFSIKGIECGFHGHFGPNGSRGSRKGFSQIGVKTIIGHSHAPGITDGCIQVGTSSRLKLEYIKGPSSHAHAHGLIYENGKRTLIFIVRGKWRG